MRTRAKLGEMTMRVELRAELLANRGYGEELRKLLRRLDGLSPATNRPYPVTMMYETWRVARERVACGRGDPAWQETRAEADAGARLAGARCGGASPAGTRPTSGRIRTEWPNELLGTPVRQGVWAHMGDFGTAVALGSRSAPRLGLAEQG